MHTSQAAALFARAVPRYTSYPTAPHFTPGVGAETVAAWLQDIPPDARLSLYLHVPFCARLCWYCGCHTSVANRYSAVARYRDALKAEIETVRRLIGHRAGVAHIHWGGGTPTVLQGEDLLSLNSALKEAFGIADDAEIAVEIDPRSLGEDMVEALAEAKVSRVSFGVQDFDPRVQAAINRVQPFGLTRDAIARVRAAGISSINLDLIYGLPLQTVASLEKTIELTLDLKPDRIALFGYAHVPWMKPHQKMIREEDLPGPELRWVLARRAANLLEQAGYMPIGIDHFALPGDALARAAGDGSLRRNFQGYTTDTAEHLIGLGASSISSFPAGYAQNATDLRDWQERATAGRLAHVRGIRLGAYDRARRDVIDRLMCHLSADLSAVAHRHGMSPSVFEDAHMVLGELMRLGIVDVAGSIIRVNPEARPLARLVAAAFDRYLSVGGGRYSVAV